MATSLTIEHGWKIIPKIETQPADLTVQAEQYTLLYEAIYPENLGEDQIRLSIRRMIDSMTLTDSSLSELG